MVSGAKWIIKLMYTGSNMGFMCTVKYNTYNMITSRLRVQWTVKQQRRCVCVWSTHHYCSHIPFFAAFLPLPDATVLEKVDIRMLPSCRTQEGCALIGIIPFMALSLHLRLT